MALDQSLAHLQSLECDPYGNYKKICRHFESKTAVNIVSLQSELLRLKLQGPQQPSEWIREREKIYQLLESSGDGVPNQKQVVETLVAIEHDGYSMQRQIFQQKLREGQDVTLDALGLALDDEWRHSKKKMATVNEQKRTEQVLLATRGRGGLRDDVLILEHMEAVVVTTVVVLDT